MVAPFTAVPATFFIVMDALVVRADVKGRKRREMKINMGNFLSTSAI
jgi:hypothetical protein